jgi:hypothetical protein
MSAIVRTIRRPRVVRVARNIGKEVFHEIVKMAYEMDKAEEQKKAKETFRSVMRFITEEQIERDYRIDHYFCANSIFYDGGLWSDRLKKTYELNDEEIHSLFLYFVWMNGKDSVHKIQASVPRGPDEHLIYKHKGRYWCMIEACCSMVIEYHTKAHFRSPQQWR